jgi:integrase
VTAIVGVPKEKYYRVFYALCASAGLRFGEALRIDISNISPDCTTIKICQKAWRGQIHDYLKSESGKREVDLHPTVAEMLKDFIGVVEKVGLGFELPFEKAAVGPNGPKLEVGPVEELAVNC